MWFVKRRPTEAKETKSSAKTIKPQISRDSASQVSDKDVLLEVPAVAVEITKAD